MVNTMSVSTAKTRMLICGLAYCLFMLLATVSQAATPAANVADLQHYQRMLPYLFTHYDENSALDVVEVDDAWLNGQFSPPGGGYAGLGIKKNALWMRFELHNSATIERDVVLEYVDHGVAHLELFQLVNGTLRSLGDASYFDPFSARPLEHLRYAYQLTVPPETTQAYYALFKVDKAGPLFSDFRLWEPRAFQEFHSIELFFYGFFTGFLCLVIVVALIFYMSTRRVAMIYYIAFVAANLYGWGFIYGFLPEVFFRDGYHWRHMIIGGALTVSFAALFTRSLLELKSHTPRIDKLILGLALFGVLPLVAALLGYTGPALIAMEVHLSGMILLVVAALVRAWQGERIAFTFFVAWGLYLCGLLIYPARELGLIDHNSLTYWMAPVGNLLEVALLLMTIRVVIRRMDREREQAQLLYTKSLEEQKAQLAEQVRERTRDLELVAERAELEARTDSLTLLPNRRLFMEQLSKHLAAIKNSGAPLSVLLLDVDKFKQINDQYGHDGGDMVLKTLAQTFKSYTRQEDVCARIGGEEFVLMMPNTDLVAAAAISERIRAEIGKLTISFNNVEISVSFTGGLVQARPGETTSNLLIRADDLLYRGKRSGRNCIVAESNVTS